MSSYQTTLPLSTKRILDAIGNTRLNITQNITHELFDYYVDQLTVPVLGSPPYEIVYNITINYINGITLSGLMYERTTGGQNVQIKGESIENVQLINRKLYTSSGLPYSVHIKDVGTGNISSYIIGPMAFTENGRIFYVKSGSETITSESATIEAWTYNVKDHTMTKDTTGTITTKNIAAHAFIKYPYIDSDNNPSAGIFYIAVDEFPYKASDTQKCYKLIPN